MFALALADEHVLVFFVLFRAGVVCQRRVYAALIVHVHLAEDVVYLGDGALECKRQRVRRAFEALQKVGTHHADQVVFPTLLDILLGYVVEGQLFGPIRSLDVLGGAILAQLEAPYVVGQVFVREFVAQVGNRIPVDGLFAMRELAYALHLVGVELLDMSARASDRDPV